MRLFTTRGELIDKQNARASRTFLRHRPLASLTGNGGTALSLIVLLRRTVANLLQNQRGVGGDAHDLDTSSSEFSG